MASNEHQIEKLKCHLECQHGIEFSVLVGSQASGRASKNSDWDIAIQWKSKANNVLQNLGDVEKLRHGLAEVLSVDTDKIDLIDIDNTQLAMREKVANSGVLLSGQENLRWNHFLDKTWRQLEYWQWEKQNVL